MVKFLAQLHGLILCSGSDLWTSPTGLDEFDTLSLVHGTSTPLGIQSQEGVGCLDRHEANLISKRLLMLTFVEFIEFCTRSIQEAPEAFRFHMSRVIPGDIIMTCI